MYESDRENGITHLLEHLRFRNANKIKNGEFYRLIDSLGLNFSACTYRDLVQFSVTGAAGALRKAGELTCLLLSPLILDRRETDLEIKRIKAEIREGDEKNSLEFFSDSFVWENTPLRNPITGTASGLHGPLRTFLRMPLRMENRHGLKPLQKRARHCLSS